MSTGLLAETLSPPGITEFLCSVLRALISAVQLDSAADATWSNVTSSWISSQQAESYFPEMNGSLQSRAGGGFFFFMPLKSAQLQQSQRFKDNRTEKGSLFLQHRTNESV